MSISSILENMYRLRRMLALFFFGGAFYRCLLGLLFFQILFYFIFYFTILYWFCHTSTWICHRCTALLLLFSYSVVSDSLWPHGLQHTKASLSFTISLHFLTFMSIAWMMPSSHLTLWCPLLLLPSIFPSIRSFPMSQFFASGSQSIRVLASASVLPMDI